MSAKNHILASLAVLGLVCAAACTSVGSAPTETPKKFTRLNVSVDAVTYEVPEPGLVEALLIDRDGRRTGWTRKGVLREINGCASQHGSEDGIPISSDTTGLDADEKALLAAMLARDSLRAEQETGPTWHYFQIGNDIGYRAGGPLGLIDQGGCELRLDPITSCMVRLAISDQGTEFRGCRDTTSLWVKPGTPQRWRLSWKVVGDSCVLKLSRLGRGSAK